VNFDFLKDDGDDDSPWPADGTEHLETDLVDERGRRIGFVIERSTANPPRAGVPPFIRWVAVTKDGEWVRNDGQTFHATEEAAEAWVEHRIRTATARYERISAERDAFRFASVRRKPAKTRKTLAQKLDATQRGLDAAGKNLRGCGCALVMLGLLILSPFIVAMLL